MPARAANDGGSRVLILRRLAAATLFVTMLLRPVHSFGQSDQPYGVSGITFGGLFPSGAFDSHVGRDGGVLGLYLALRSGNSPALFGLELSASYYGHVHRSVPMENIPEVMLDVDTYNNIVQGLFFVRLQPRMGAVTPYFEGLAGVSYIYTDTTVRDDDADEEVAYDVNFSDWTVTAGAGAGVMLRLHRRHAPGRGGTFLDFKVRYMAGGRAAYLRQGALIVEGDQVIYAFDRSGTSFFTVQTGLSWSF